MTLRPSLILSLLHLVTTILLMFQRFPNAPCNSGQQESNRERNLISNFSLKSLPTGFSLFTARKVRYRTDRVASEEQYWTLRGQSA